MKLLPIALLALALCVSPVEAQSVNSRVGICNVSDPSICNQLGVTVAQQIGFDNVNNANLGAFPYTSGVVTVAPVPAAAFMFNGTGWDRARLPSSSSRLVSSAAGVNATSAKSTTGWLFGILAYNTNAAVRYLKIYNKASAPVVGTDTPVLTIALPPGSFVQIPFGSPLYLNSGIAFAITTGSADSDTGAVGAADIVGLNLTYS